MRESTPENLQELDERLALRLAQLRLAAGRMVHVSLKKMDQGPAIAAPRAVEMAPGAVETVVDTQDDEVLVIEMADRSTLVTTARRLRDALAHVRGGGLRVDVRLQAAPEG